MIGQRHYIYQTYASVLRFDSGCGFRMALWWVHSDSVGIVNGGLILVDFINEKVKAIWAVGVTFLLKHRLTSIFLCLQLWNDEQ